MKKRGKSPSHGHAFVPDLSRFTRSERRIISRCPTPRLVQAWLNHLPYNTEEAGGTQRSFRVVVRTGMAHCLEAALSAAVILEHYGYPPLVLSFESADHLDHVIFVYRARNGRWGSVARSRDPGLHGRRPLFARPRDLALSYVDPYVDFTGHITGYAVVNLRELMGGYDWRLSERNLWKVEQALIDWPHRRIAISKARIRKLRRRYRAFRRAFPARKPLYYDRSTWKPIPRQFHLTRTQRAWREGGKEN